MKIADSYSVIVIPKDKARIQRWVVSRERILGVLGIAVVFIAFSAAVTAGLVHYRGEYVATEDLRLRGRQYEKERAHVLAKLDELESVVSQNEEWVSRLEAVVGLHPDKGFQIGALSSAPSLGKNLPSAFHLAALAPSSAAKNSADIFDEKSLKVFNLKAIDLTAEAEEIGERMEKVYHFSPDAEYFWSSVPTAAPVAGWVTSDFGLRRSPMSGARQLHQGMDIASPYGSAVKASGDGVVTFVGRRGGLGNEVVVDHGYGVATVYGHNSQLIVKAGEKVSRGQIIARVGSSGRSTGPHLHYEVLVHGVPVDPHRFMLEQL